MITEALTRDRLKQRSMPRLAVIRATWQHAGLGLVSAIAAGMNLFRLTREGYGNSYYAAAVKSMLMSWHNFFFVSFDPGGFVTVDKPPIGFWIQTASAKFFGFHGWSLLLPEAVAGVCSVALLYHLVRRIFGAPAGLIAALALAVTPISVVTNRNNTIDSLLVLTVLLAAWAVMKATETGCMRWLLVSMALVGIGFNIKMLEAYLVLPALVAVYLFGAPHRWRTRIMHLALATVILLVVSLSWATAVDLTPAGARPYVGSTQNNSELSLALGYNGINRLLGHGGAPDGSAPGGTTGQGSAIRPPSGGDLPAGFQPPGGGFPGGGPGGPGGNGGPGGVGENGAQGILRLLDPQLAGQIGWLLPLALVGLVGAGGWLFVRPARGRFASADDERDSRALEPVAPVRAFARIGQFLRTPLHARQQAVVLWGLWTLTMAAFFSVAGMFHRYYLSMLAPGIAALVGIGLVVLWHGYRRRHPLGWLLPLALVGTAVVQAKVLADYPSYARWLTPLVIGASVVAGLGLVLARMRSVSLAWGRLALAAATLGLCALLVAPTVWAAVSVRDASNGALPVAGPSLQGQGFGLGFPDGGPDGNRGVGMDGMLGGANSAVIAYLESNRGDATYLVAVPSAMSASSIILATGEPVMAMGGFTGSDPILTADRLAQLVKDGTVRYFLLGGGGPGGGFGGQASAVQWVTNNCIAVSSRQWQTSATTSSDGGFSGSQQLYDCASTATRG